MVRPDDGELYRKHADDLVSLATTLVGHSAAPDVVAAAVERTIGSAHWDRVDDRYAYWVRAVLNEARASYRSSMRRAQREEVVVRRDRPIEGAGDEDGHPDLLAALIDLSLQQRTVVYLAYWRDLPSADIAALLGVSDGTVRRQLARARSKLRRTLA